MAACEDSLRTRRHFIAGAGALGLVAAVGRAAAGTAFKVDEPRTLSFVHTHTGEQLTTEYFVDGQYQPGSLKRIDHLLRDFRTGDIHRMDPTLLDLLFVLQKRSRSEGPYAVICGYRSPATNAMLRRTTEGVAAHSMHLEGRAIDIRLPGFATARLGEIARSLGRGGVGFYPRSDFVHVDTGRVRFW